MLLVIDDDEETNYCMHRKCQRLGIESIQARDYSYAIEVLKSQEIKLVFCDMVFGNEREGGINFLNLVKKENISTPVVIITGMDDHILKAKAMAAGAHDYIIKPIKNADISVIYKNVAQ